MSKESKVRDMYSLIKVRSYSRKAFNPLAPLGEQEKTKKESNLTARLDFFSLLRLRVRLLLVTIISFSLFKATSDVRVFLLLLNDGTLLMIKKKLTMVLGNYFTH